MLLFTIQTSAEDTNSALNIERRCSIRRVRDLFCSWQELRWVEQSAPAIFIKEPHRVYGLVYKLERWSALPACTNTDKRYKHRNSSLTILVLHAMMDFVHVNNNIIPIQSQTIVQVKLVKLQ